MSTSGHWDQCICHPLCRTPSRLNLRPSATARPPGSNGLCRRRPSFGGASAVPRDSASVCVRTSSSRRGWGYGMSGCSVASSGSWVPIRVAKGSFGRRGGCSRPRGSYGSSLGASSLDSVHCSFAVSRGFGTATQSHCSYDASRCVSRGCVSTFTLRPCRPARIASRLRLGFARASARSYRCPRGRPWIGLRILP